VNGSSHDTPDPPPKPRKSEPISVPDDEEESVTNDEPVREQTNNNGGGRFVDKKRMPLPGIDILASDKGFTIDVCRTVTIPSFLQATPPRPDQCPSGPGGSARELGYFAPVETTLFREILENRCNKLNSKGLPPLVVDVGANVGYFSAYAASFGCRVMAFEPIPKIIRFLNLTILLNGLTDLVEIYQGAVSESEGTSRASMNCAENGLSGVDSNGQFHIKTFALDDLVHEDVLLLKIDTEGYEDNVFKGMKKMQQKYKIDNIICETKSSGDVDYKRNFINRMIDEGYTVSAYGEEYWNNLEAWQTKIKQPFDKNHLMSVTKLGGGGWIPREDLWYRKV
jgi:FkbM family methyltransferase